jgi:hypothetical protein
MPFSGVFDAPFLQEVDRVSGQDSSHREEGIRRRMESLVFVFAGDVLSYAVMSNSIHQILRNRPAIVAMWTDDEVAIRGLRVFSGRRIEKHLAEPTENDVRMLVANRDNLELFRQRLSDISWFMRAAA